MPRYRTKVTADSLLGHPGAPGSPPLTAPSLEFRVLFPKLQYGPPHLRHFNAMNGVWGIPYCSLQHHSIMSRASFQRFGVDETSLRTAFLPITRALRDRNRILRRDAKGNVIHQTHAESVQVFETTVTIKEHPVIPDPPHQLSDDHDITFLIVDDLPVPGYICLGHEFIGAHLQLVPPPKRIRTPKGFTLEYEMRAIHGSFCAPPLPPHPVVVLS